MQPLAMGYYVSTAPTGPLPRWIWSHCPHKEDNCPVCFKVHTTRITGGLIYLLARLESNKHITIRTENMNLEAYFVP